MPQIKASKFLDSFIRQIHHEWDGNLTWLTCTNLCYEITEIHMTGLVDPRQKLIWGGRRSKVRYCLNTYTWCTNMSDTHFLLCKKCTLAEQCFLSFCRTRSNSRVLWWPCTSTESTFIHFSLTSDSWHGLPCLENVSHSSTPSKK